MDIFATTSSCVKHDDRDIFLATATACYILSSPRFSLEEVENVSHCGEYEYYELIHKAIKGSRIVVLGFTKEFINDLSRQLIFEEIMRCQIIPGKEVHALFLLGNNAEDKMWSVRFEEAFERLIAGHPLEELWRTAAVEAVVESSWEASISAIRDGNYMEHIIGFIRRIEVGDWVNPRHQVGISYRVEETLHLSQFDSKDNFGRGSYEQHVTIVGIWGKEGIGKTTVARVIYNNIRQHFMLKSFLANIKNVWEQDNGQIYLQKQLLSDVTNTKFVEIDGIEMGVRKLQTKLRSKKVLVILDDVTQKEQLMVLCGSSKWFGSGSLIFITTRNKHLFDDFKVKHVYEMKELDKKESLELFSLYAFEQHRPISGFMEISKKAVTLCEGLPLALEVLGSLLNNRTIPEWKHILKIMKGIPNGQIREKLKISYDFLADWEKDIFVNIACFHVGKRKRDVTQIFHGSKFPVESGIDELIERSLIKIDEMNDKLHVHDVLQEIVRGIDPKKPRPKYVYDVFLSFRGEDTRRSFATHLYTSLKQAGIEVFMDKGITRGENIPSSLMKAIETSRISIIILSTNYGGSKWCLQELEKIMECHRTVGQEVLPIFYDVQPSDVRKQINTFGKALDGLITRMPTSEDQKLNWQRVLTESANLSGWNLHDYRTETELIDNILETITTKLDDNKCLFVAHHPVGLRSRVQDIIHLLSNKSNEVIIAGFWGMGGIGKTTIAKAIYNEIGQNFEGKSFVANIRGVWEQDNGQVHLQEQLLSDILKTRRVTLPSIELGKTIMKEKLCHKRALIVLDDVNNVDQLNALYGSHEWFGRGSRIIITTRDEHLLKILQPVVHVYNVKEMDISESLELFSWHAFKQAIPQTDFFQLSRRVVSYCGGLPLALEILGSYLFDRTIPAWESVLEKLQGILNNQIHEKLKISYDGLSDHSEKEIFLDICCFFIGKDRNYATQILNGCGLQAEIGITRLIELSLVKIDKNNKLGMHDLLRDMGRHIIHELSPDEPEKRTRLWFHKDALDVLKNNIGTITIKGLALNLWRNNVPCFSTKAFKKMKRLRLLQLDYVKLTGDYEYLSKELRWLYWHGFPLDNIPANFSQENVVAINLKYSNLTQVWEKSQLLESLKILNLSHSHYLTQTPNFSKLPSLEKLILKDCPRLSMVHPNIGDLKHIILLNLKDCKDLNHLPRSIYNLKSLETLDISGCSKIDKLEEDIEQMGSLTTLVANQTAIAQVPFSLVRSKSISYVSLCGYEGLSCDVFPSLISSWMSPTNNPRSLIQAFGYMPFLLHNLSHSLFAKRSAILETGPSTSQVACGKSPASIDSHEHVHMEGLKNLKSSLTIHFGGFNKVTDTLLKSISQGWSDKGFGDYSLPGDNYPDWLNFKGKGLSVLFKVPQVTGKSLEGVVLCIVYLSSQDNMASVYPVSVLIKDYTEPKIEFYKRDAATTSNDEEWHKIISNLVPGNEVEVKVDFAHQFTVKETLLYLIYDEDVDKRIMIDYRTSPKG